MSKGSAFKREIVFNPAFDRRSSEPSQNFGIHGVEMRWYLTGKKGVVQFVVYTNWQLPHVEREQEADARSLLRPMPADLGYHSPVPRYEGQDSTHACELLGGATCYYDGSGLAAQEAFDVLVQSGSEEMWRYLESYYAEVFEGMGGGDA